MTEKGGPLTLIKCVKQCKSFLTLFLEKNLRLIHKALRCADIKVSCSEYKLST